MFEIVEFDKDYHAVTGRHHQEFKSEDDAIQWCNENSWTGYTYHCVKTKDRDSSD